MKRLNLSRDDGASNGSSSVGIRENENTGNSSETRYSLRLSGFNQGLGLKVKKALDVSKPDGDEILLDVKDCEHVYLELNVTGDWEKAIVERAIKDLTDLMEAK